MKNTKNNSISNNYSYVYFIEYLFITIFCGILITVISAFFLLFPFAFFYKRKETTKLAEAQISRNSTKLLVEL